MASTAILAIRIISDAKNATAGIDQTTTKVSKMSRAGDLAGKALAGGLLAAGAAAVKMAGAAAEDEQAAAKLAQTLKTAAGATDTQVASAEKWIEAQGKALGVTDDELRPALARLTTATKDVGEAQRLTALAMDISAGTGKNLQTVTEALQKAQNGSLGGLTRLGVNIKNAAGETKSLSAVQKDLAKTYAGAAAKSADTAAGRQKILQVRMAELGEEVGSGLLPVLEKLTAAGLKAVDWISKNQTQAKILVGTIVGLLVVVKALSVATTVANGVQAISNALTAKSTAAKTADAGASVAQKTAALASAAASKVAAAAQWVWNAAMSANPIGLVIIAVVALVAAIVIAYKKSERFREIVQAVGRAAAKAFGWVIDKVKDLIGWVKDKAVKAFGVMKTITGTYLRVMTLPIRTLIGWIQDLIGWVKDKASDAWRRLKENAVTAWRVMTEPTRILIDKIRSVIDWVKVRMVLGFRVMREKAMGPINAIRDAFGWVWEKVQAVIGAVQDLVGWIKNIDFPDVPGWVGDLGGAIGGAVGMSSSGMSVAPRTAVTEIHLNGVIDSAGAAREIDTLLGRRSRRVYGSKVISYG